MERLIKWVPPQARRMLREAERLMAAVELETLYVSENGSTFRYRNGARQPVPKSMLPLAVKRKAKLLRKESQIGSAPQPSPEPAAATRRSDAPER